MDLRCLCRVTAERAQVLPGLVAYLTLTVLALHLRHMPAPRLGAHEKLQRFVTERGAHRPAGRQLTAAVGEGPGGGGVGGAGQRP